jgi:hypothetical protein
MQLRCRVDMPVSSAKSSWLRRRAARHSRSNAPIGGWDTRAGSVAMANPSGGALTQEYLQMLAP